jgi:XTP/dITP diphosphohydrolase
MPKLLITTGNRHKLVELKSLFRDLPYKLISPSDIGLNTKVDETCDSFSRNARLKALAFSTSSHILSLADDSGLEVDALDGAPGVMSARYAGTDATDTDRVNLLLLRLKDIPEGKRQATFKCVIAIAKPIGNVYLFFGECRGTISFKPTGEYGFGYDPIFYLPHLGKTMAQLSQKEKNNISHRGQAAVKARTFLLDCIYNKV